MLSWFRKHSRSKMAKVLYVVLAISFFGGFGLVWRLGKRGPEELANQPIAKVAGEPISYREFLDSFERARRRFINEKSEAGEDFDEVDFDRNSMKQKVLDELVEHKLLLKRAEEAGIVIGSEEVNNDIRTNPLFKDQQGNFSPEKYTFILERLNMSPDGFKKQVEEGLKIQRFLNLVSAGIGLREGELEEYFMHAEQEVNLEYFYLDIDKLFGKEKPSEKDIEDYYNSHQKEFDLPETRKIRFLKIHIPDYMKEVKLTEEEVEEYYEGSKERYLLKGEEVRASHILIRVKEDASEQEVEVARKKASEILIRAQSGEDFGELAKKFSEDPASAQQGGDLGFFSRGEMIPEFEKEAFSLGIGEVSGPVRSRYGFHIVKVEDKRPAEYKPLSEVRGEVEDNLRHTKAFSAAKAQADKLREDSLNLGMEKAKEKNPEIKAKLFISEFFSRREAGIPELGKDSKDITEQCFYLEQGKISEVMEGEDDLYIVELLAIKEPHQASLDEVRSRIERKLTPEVQAKKAKEKAREYLRLLREGITMKEVAKMAGVSVSETGFFVRGGFEVPGIGNSPEILDAVFRVDEKNPLPDDVYQVHRRIYVFRLKESKAPDLKELEKNRSRFEAELLSKKREATFKDYMDKLKKLYPVEILPLYEEI